MRNTEGPKEEKFKWHQEFVVVQALNKKCLSFNGVDALFQSNINVKDTVIILINGDIP